MLGHLFRKEILDHISSLRFLILSTVGGLIIWASLFSGYTYYQARLRDYQSAQAANAEGIRQFTIADKLNTSDTWMEINFVTRQINKPPTPMCIFIRGLEPISGRSFSLVDTKYRSKLSPAATEPILGLFPPLDLGLVVQVVLSLFVLLFTYDAVCGEKEAGTLRLTASFSVPRDRLLLGKLFGALIPTLTAFGLPLMLGVAAALLMPDVQLSGLELTRLGFILVAFGLYLTAFTCAGLFASCLAYRAATSFVLLLAFWVATVVVLPRLSLVAADGFRPAPSVYEYQAERSLISKESSNKHRELIGQWQQEHSRPGQEWFRTPEGQEAHRLYASQTLPVVVELFEPQFARIEEAFRNRYNARLELAVILARSSPAFALKNAAVRLAGAGLDRQKRFEMAFDQHRKRDVEWFYYKAQPLDMLRLANPAKYGERKWDVSDMPRFAYRETWPGEEVRSALVDVGMLALWGLAFFAGAYSPTHLLTTHHLLFTYDAVCGEKEAGTLRLYASFPTPRSTLALAKLVGSTVAVLVPFVFSCLLASAVLALSPGLGLRGEDWMRMAALMVVFALYLTVFAAFGLFVSALTHRRMTAFLGLLGIWTVWLFIVPNLAVDTVSRLAPAQSIYDLQKQDDVLLWETRTRVRAEKQDYFQHNPVKDWNALRSDYNPLLAYRSSLVSEAQMQAIQDALYRINILNLVLLAVLGFAGAYVAILRYDVR